MSALKRLRATGLPLDWTTVMVGYSGVDWFCEDVSAGEVIDLATSQLVDVEEPPDGPLTQLACARPDERDLIADCLEKLAARCGVSRAVAERKWRYLLATQLLDYATRVSDRMPSESPSPTGLGGKLLAWLRPPSESEWVIDLVEVVGDIYCFWRRQPGIPPAMASVLRPSDTPNPAYTPEHLKELVSVHRAWLAEEYASLRDVPAIR
jgi:hypothetical protein